MLGYMFENRNTTLKSVIKIADCLGRSLRENVQLFSIDSENKRASFLTESMNVIEGTYNIKNSALLLEDITVQDSTIFSDNESFDDFVSSKVKTFVGNIFESEYPEADNSFDSILTLWKTRLQFNDVRKKLDEKANAFSDTNDIITTPEFKKFLEAAPQVVSWLEDSKTKISNISEIKNAIKLSDAVSKAFNIPYISMEQLTEDKKITFDNEINKTIYEMLCRQELVSKELLESKHNFDLVWANNNKISNLASMVYEEKQDNLAETLSEALTEVPYLALASKKQLRETFSKALNIDSSSESFISDKDIKSFASLIFEMKKPIKTLLIKTINEKYGVNVQNLKEIASFRGLVEAQIVIFESLQRLSPRNSLVKEVFGDVSQMLREKSGVEAIDVNNILQALFTKSGYSTLYENNTISQTVTLQEIFEHELSSSEIVSLLEEKEVAAKKKLPKKKKVKVGGPREEDAAETPEEVQARLSGKEEQYAEATEEAPEEAEVEAEEEEPMSKKDFFKTIEDFTEILKGNKKEVPEEEEELPEVPEEQPEEEQ